jgi:serine phosphatase RsbU (regulator of sigma subunit)
MRFISFVICFLFWVVVAFGQTNIQTNSVAWLKRKLVASQDNTERIEVLTALAKALLHDNPKEALKYSAESIAIQEDSTITKQNILVYLTHVTVLEKNDQTEKVAKNYKKIATYYEKQQDVKQQTEFLIKAGQTYQQLGDFDKALECYYACATAEQQADEIFGQIEAANLAGGILRIQRKTPEAFTVFFDNLRQAIKLNKNTADSHPEKKQTLLLLAENYNFIGVTHYLQNNFDSALFYYNKCYSLRVDAKDSIAIAKSLNNIGLIYRKKNSYSQALRYFTDASNILLAKQDSTLAIAALDNVGFTYSLMGENEKALYYLNSSLALAFRKKAATRILEGYESLVTHYVKVGDYKSAYQYENKINALKDSLFNENSSKQTAAMQALYETEQHKQSIATHKLASQNKTNVIYLSVAAFILTFIAAIIFYSRFRLKKKSNELLQEQYNEINQQKEELDSQRGYIEEQNKVLTKQHTDIVSSINYARRIQQAALPPMEDIRKAFTNSFVLFLPKDVVSGDFYWFAEEKDEKTDNIYQIIAAVDCTGHGVPGAFMSLIGNTLLDEIVHISNVFSPDLILAELDKRIRKMLKQYDDSSQKDGMDLSICSYNKTLHLLDFAGAMNPLLAIIDGEAHLYKGNRFPIGGTYLDSDIKVFTKHRLDLNQAQGKAIFYLFSDGFQDQFGGKQKRKFMLKNFRTLLFHIHQQSFNYQKEILENTLKQWQEEGHEQQIDDVLVIGFEIKK